ncbi:MAG: sugar ABC transporter permease, partial [Clostridia bacterium]
MDQYRKNKRIIVMFLLPALLIYVVLAVIPIIQSLWYSLFDWPGIAGVPMEWVGFKNFEKLLKMKDFGRAFKNAGLSILINLVLQIPLGYLLAYLLSDYCKGYRFFKTVFFTAVVLPITATALLWKFMFGPNQSGILNSILLGLGLGSGEIGWLLQSSTALLCINIANAWCGFGYHMTIGFAAITGVPKEILESSEIDGATSARRFVSIILPIIWESVKTSTILIVIGSIKLFDIVFVMTEGGPNGLTHMPATLLYYEAFKYQN